MQLGEARWWLDMITSRIEYSHPDLLSLFEEGLILDIGCRFIRYGV
jgi:hypothetical protein